MCIWMNSIKFLKIFPSISEERKSLRNDTPRISTVLTLCVHHPGMRVCRSQHPHRKTELESLIRSHFCLGFDEVINCPSLSIISLGFTFFKILLDIIFIRICPRNSDHFQKKHPLKKRRILMNSRKKRQSRNHIET